MRDRFVIDGNGVRAVADEVTRCTAPQQILTARSACREDSRSTLAATQDIYFAVDQEVKEAKARR